MKPIAILLVTLIALDLALFRGAYSIQVWGLARTEIESLRGYADDHTRVMPRG